MAESWQWSPGRGVIYGFPCQAAVKKSSTRVNLYSGRSSFHSADTSRAPTEMPSSIPATMRPDSFSTCSEGMAGWSARGSHVVLTSPALRSFSSTVSMAKGPPGSLSVIIFGGHQGVSLTYLLSNGEQLPDSHSLAPDATDNGPRSQIVNSLGHEGAKVMGSDETEGGVFGALEHNGSAVLKVELILEGMDVLRRFVGTGEVVDEHAGLEEAVFDHLNRMLAPSWVYVTR